VYITIITVISLVTAAGFVAALFNSINEPSVEDDSFYR
jgi:hypothetical protein